METKYLEKNHGADQISYKCFNDRLEISFWNDGQVRIDNDSCMDAEYFLQDGYTEITRQEFMDAYLPISEKLNNQIAEL